MNTNKIPFSFWNTNPPVSSKRAKVAKNLANEVRKSRNGIDSSFPSNEIQEFEDGFNLLGLSEVSDYRKFFAEKGLYYVHGIIVRKKQNLYFPKLDKQYREAQKYREFISNQRN